MNEPRLAYMDGFVCVSRGALKGILIHQIILKMARLEDRHGNEMIFDLID